MAIRHIVMFKFSAEATSAQRQAVKEGLKSLKAKIPEIKAIACNTDAGLAEGNYDFCACVDFDSVEGYKAYATNEDHQTLIKETIKPILAGRSAVQIVLED
eukprot:CAMPEP_0119414070 /NCGR_PEP_ID=MMETSP1335-20130426/6445_1 /TAXON_ID=259385 /ORGANISM="Chrysoculter rhomboideus, Strain RCC1486" /LENGTH=100 /DNA_ID=CAMNT_0007438921 /DNA_START=20 /DNA_END=322 /DNA_ORIENTATION=+